LAGSKPAGANLEEKALSVEVRIGSAPLPAKCQWRSESAETALSSMRRVHRAKPKFGPGVKT
jgi:hypothetical protein